MDGKLLDTMKQPILITGCARSGTSLIAGIIDICGAKGGETAGPTGDNKKGMFENTNIRDNIEKHYLKSINCDPKGQNPLPDTNDMNIPVTWQQRVEGVMTSERVGENEQWYYKSGKSALIWPVWHYAFPGAKWIIVRRRSADIAESCLNTGFMNAYENYEDWIKWINHHEEKFVQMIQAGLNVKVIWPERLMKWNYEQLYELIEWLGLEWREKDVREFIEPKLWKARKKEKVI